MLTKRMSVVLSLGAVLMAGCTGPEVGSEAAVTVFEGARLIVGDGSAPIEDAVFVVEGDRFTHAGRRRTYRFRTEPPASISAAKL